MSETLSSAMVAALGALNNVTKNATNPHFKNRYASLDAILDAVRPILHKNGLALSQTPLTADGMVGVTTRIIHTSGESTESTLLLPAGQNTAQGYGSALTYARRYSISSILGIAADDDDDGQIASGPPGRSTATHSLPRVETKERKGAEVTDVNRKDNPKADWDDKDALPF